MGLLKKLRKARRQKKIDVKAAQARARQEVKTAAKLELKRDKLLAQQENRLYKSQAKAAKRQHKYNVKEAKEMQKQLRAGRFNASTILRYATALRTIAPFLLPVIYRLITAGREQVSAQRARKLGISTDQLAQFSGHGGPLKARISGIRSSVAASSLPVGFKRDVEERLTELVIAVDNSEYMTNDQRTRAHRSITKDLDQITQQIQEKLA
ncbi:Uncharacterised protein [Corynebacterium kutscheri]|uniref:Uncharacterized protein n=1 Tax=Corynebacterium kutscheri TaxID=35755 RepID=A0A0F6R178_9CORY|nr:DUF6474 family protein [Corynebacterium kutscheri]AKE42167.1 hypothetical protein UL82_10150 [Corynebacterium kutscheri]VEH05842.1 Uncharacterised protein [Corynebacterium kutscheri]VEH10510.1 Uncharacterised protein [Corynebacterium kutscheri]VEH81736.1 Uncharacterised protein [Corynebacterium kutscheri]